MLKKKSYMNQSNLLGEGFFDKLFKLLKTDSKVKSKVKSDPKIKTQLKKLNNTVGELEKALEDQFGHEVNLEKYKLSDFD
tara:strand:- start:196 stop:435 length:240 start_codon:yes stop_codon:yes gene_type:complete